MFRPNKRKSRPISTPATHTFFTSDLPDDCENGITAFAAEFDVSLDETDVYGNLEFKSFLEDAAPIKICDVTSSQPESEDTENSRTEDLVQTNVHAKVDQENGSDLHVPQHGIGELKYAGLSQKRSRSVSGDDAEDDGEEVFLRGNSAGLVGSSLLRRKGRAPPPPKRLSSLHPLDEDTCQDVTSDIAANQVSSMRSRDTETGCDKSSDHNDGHGSTLIVTHQPLVAELTKRQKTKSDLYNVIEQTDAADVKADEGSQQDQSALGADSERFTLVHLQKNCARMTSTQNATGGDCSANLDVSGTVSAENPAKDVKLSGDVSMAARPRDIAIGSSCGTKPKATVGKPKIPVKPGHLKSPVAVGLPEIPKVKEDKNSGCVLDVSTPENLLSPTDGRGDGEGNTEKIQGNTDQNVRPRTPETEAKCNEVVPEITTPAKWVLLPKYSTHDDDKSKRRQRILRTGDKNVCQKTSETEAKGNGRVAKTITHDRGLLHAQNHTRGGEHDTRTTPEVMSCEDQTIRKRTVETEARCPEQVPEVIKPEVIKPDKGLLHMKGCYHDLSDSSDERQQTVYTENQSKSLRPSETLFSSATGPVSKVNPLERDCIRCDNGNTDKKQRVILTEDQITSRRTCESSVKTSSRIATVVGGMKCDSDLSSEESVTIVTGAGQPLASTPIPPPRRKKLRNRDRLKNGLPRDTTDSVSASSSMSSEHSVGQGPSKKTTSTTTGQHGISGSKDVDVPSLSPFLPSPVRMSSQSLDRESDGGIYENVPPPPQFDNSHSSLSTIMGNDRLSSSTAQHQPSIRDQEMLSEDLVGHSDRKLGRDKVTSSSRCHPQLGSGDKLRDFPPSRATSDTTVVPGGSSSLKEKLSNRNQLNILVEEDYLPGHVSTVPEDLPLHPTQPWEVSMAMSAHLMDLASRPWDDTVVPPIGKTSGGARPTVVDYVWQMKPVELWDTSDVCDWCKTVLDFGALADAFEGKGFVQFAFTHAFFYACQWVCLRVCLHWCVCVCIGACVCESGLRVIIADFKSN